MDLIRYEVDGDGIATLTWDVPGRPVNVVNEETIRAFDAAVRRAVADDAVKGVIVASGKGDFVAGADLEWLVARRDPKPFYDGVMDYHEMSRVLETCGKPFVAAVNGPALGGGWEIALMCHARIATTNPATRVGLPEVTLGVLPGGGGTQRTARMLGVTGALPLLLEGKRLRVADAKALGLVDEIVEPADLLAAAKRRLLANPAATQPWDRKGYKIPGGAVQSRAVLEAFSGGMAMLRKRTWGNYPATTAIMSCVYEGLQLPIDEALRVEARYFVEIVGTPEARAMVRTLFFALNDANKLKSRPADVPKTKFAKVGVLGAGMMGAGIAAATAKRGAQVVLIDRTLELAQAGKALARGDDVQARIEATDSYDALADADLVIEAVFEDRGVKAGVTQRADAVLPARAVFGSNTSTLPISGLAEASTRRGRFIGIHFFSPVEKMPLVEIIRGRNTSDATLAKALDYVRFIGKTPIVVNDSRGFFTSRVFATYVQEGLALLQEGVKPALIENAGRLAGMAVGPLAVADEISLELPYHIIAQTKADLGAAYVPGPADDVIEAFATTLDRPGRKAGRGLYEYPADGKKYLWPGLAEHFPVVAEQPPVDEVKRRLLYVQTAEALRCYAEGVIASKPEGDVGSILGWGFPPFTGGVFSLPEYVGEERFTTECADLAARFGPRFLPG